jgi:hypothetical protein
MWMRAPDEPPPPSTGFRELPQLFSSSCCFPINSTGRERGSRDAENGPLSSPAPTSGVGVESPDLLVQRSGPADRDRSSRPVDGSVRASASFPLGLPGSVTIGSGCYRRAAASPAMTAPGHSRRPKTTCTAARSFYTRATNAMEREGLSPAHPHSFRSST